MNYQLSLDPCGNLPTQENPGDEDGMGTGSAHVRALTETSTLRSSQGLDESGSVSATALINRDADAAGSNDSDPPAKGKSGFDKVKAHRAPRAPVEEPKLAPSWASSGTTGPKSDGPWEGYRFI